MFCLKNSAFTDSTSIAHPFRYLFRLKPHLILCVRTPIWISKFFRINTVTRTQEVRSLHLRAAFRVLLVSAIMPVPGFAVAVLQYNCTSKPLQIRQDLIAPTEGLKLFFLEDFLFSIVHLSLGSTALSLETCSVYRVLSF